VSILARRHSGGNRSGCLPYSGTSRKIYPSARIGVSCSSDLTCPSSMFIRRFIGRAKMHEIQMLGLVEHDVLSSIEVPFLPEKH
jgi:hypothetical protein